MSRVLPVLLGVLVLAGGLALGYQVLTSDADRQASPATAAHGAPAAPAPPASLPEIAAPAVPRPEAAEPEAADPEAADPEAAAQTAPAPASPGDGTGEVRGTGAAVDPVPPQGHLYSGVFEEPVSCNPITTRSGVVRRYVLGFTHDTLFDIDPRTGALRGALAESWQVDAGGDGMVVTLRQGVQFADGAPMTMEDVMFTFQLVRSPGMVSGTLVEGVSLVDRIERLDDRRLHLHFGEQHFDRVRLVGLSWVVLQRRWYEAALQRQAALSGEPVPAPSEPRFGELLSQVRTPGPGTGPYAFVDDDGVDGEQRASWRPGRDLTLFRNDNSWWRRARPGTWNFSGIRLLFVTDQAAMYSALHRRRVDWYSGGNMQSVLDRDPGLQEHYRRVVYDLAEAGAYLVQWNLHRPQLEDVRVRRALGMLFDRAAIVDKVFGGNAYLARAFDRVGAASYPSDLETLPFDPSAARRLLREAGYGGDTGRRLSLRLLAPIELPAFRQIGELAVDAARAAGVELELQVVPFQTISDRRAMGDDSWDAALLLFWLVNDDPFNQLHSHGGLNPTGWVDAVADDLLERQRRETDPARRVDLLRQLHRRVFDEQPVCLLAHPRGDLLLEKHLQNAEPGPLGLWPERFWMPVDYQRPGP